MTSKQDFQQAPHKLLVIPGPIEISDSVLFANAHPSVSHVGPEFIKVFGDSLRMFRKVLCANDDSQPFIVSGSGTLGWDMVSANLLTPSAPALVVNTGYFGDSFTECLETYGVSVDQIKAPLGGTVSLTDLETALRKKHYEVVTFTHVDTSTAVLSDAKSITETVKRVSPETLVVMDAVCSVASEEIQFDDWGLDVVLTASQKGLGCPPGLCLLLASKNAMEKFSKRIVPPGSYYASWKKWLPIMKAYEAGTPAYFATPPTNIIFALHESLSAITSASPSLQERWNLHKEASDKVKSAVKQLGGKMVSEEDESANGMTAVYYPQGKVASDILPKLGEQGVVVAGGLHKEIKDKYFRIGHMGVSVVDKSRGDVDKIVDALKAVLVT